MSSMTKAGASVETGAELALAPAGGGGGGGWLDWGGGAGGGGAV